MSGYYCERTGPQTWTVGSDGEFNHKWYPVSDHPSQAAAEFEANRLNKELQDILRAARPTESEPDYGRSPWGWGLM